MTASPPAISRPQAVFPVLQLAVTVLFPQVIQRNISRFADQLQHFPQTDYYKIFESAVRLWQQAPWAGVGTRYYNRACYHYNYVSCFEGCAVHPHNVHLEWLNQNDLIGLPNNNYAGPVRPGVAWAPSRAVLPATGGRAV